MAGVCFCVPRCDISCDFFFFFREGDTNSGRLLILVFRADVSVAQYQNLCFFFVCVVCIGDMYVTRDFKDDIIPGRKSWRKKPFEARAGRLLSYLRLEKHHVQDSI